ncbi:hypothetical protein AQS8620_02650 [Aquimixticola soesokkakensis]|uniref:Glycosyl transferase family 2 n=1 Tax=Aquimixticola soesokkakensis TaxID=1519096 RepID=A0A1Y5TDC6_9RHOB|nr:glycosyltransferase family 2 protein [Aquimixticola soesokkakensis]SLN59434.1 hypothetical protein AQS8620_02650 [Aquimixticola soesokkakensis]
MRYTSLAAFLSDGSAALAKGPVALIFAEDLCEIASTLRHHIGLGFRETVLFGGDDIDLDEALEAQIHRVPLDMRRADVVVDTVNAVIAAAPDLWFYYCYNAEFLFFPFCETRTIGELLAFHTEERRSAMLTYVVDLYAADLSAYPDAVALDEAYLDKSGYYALGRKGPDGPRERQLDFFGGLRWRFEEHVPANRRKIDRIAIFKAAKGLKLRPDHTFSEEEYNTYSCPWHHNLTASIASFRTAKALKTNAGSAPDIKSFMWHNSEEFQWHSQQFLDLGLMETGQWF